MPLDEELRIKAQLEAEKNPYDFNQSVEPIIDFDEIQRKADNEEVLKFRMSSSLRVQPQSAILFSRKEKSSAEVKPRVVVKRRKILDVNESESTHAGVKDSKGCTVAVEVEPKALSVPNAEGSSACPGSASTSLLSGLVAYGDSDED